MDSAARLTARARYESLVGPWSEIYDPVLRADPELMDAFIDLCAVPVAKGHLEPGTRELIGIAANASTTHLYEPAVRMHIANALALGVEPQQIVEVVDLTSVLGIHTCEMAMDVLTEQVQATGAQPPALGRAELALRERFASSRGVWPEALEEVLRWDVELLEAYLACSTIPWRRGRLEPKVKELIHIAIDASTTSLHEAGTRLHIENALRAGASREEVVEVLELISQIGIHSCTMGIPILLEEMAATQADDTRPAALDD